jgi:hypothetical protein
MYGGKRGVLFQTEPIVKGEEERGSTLPYPYKCEPLA